MKMEAYVGTKIVKAVEMTDHEYNRKIKRSDPKKGQPASHGYMVEYINGDNWLPKKMFENTYRKINQSEIELINSTMPKESDSI